VGGALKIVGGVFSLDGTVTAHGEVTQTVGSFADADACGVKLAEVLKRRGASEILAAIPRENINAAPVVKPPSSALEAKERNL
jgi:hypothetical protein